MEEAINRTLVSFVSEHLLIHVVIILLASLLMLVSMAVDLYFGVKKAKKNGEVTTSTGLKKTCEKARKYFSPYMVLICIDLLSCVIVPFPAFSMIWAAYCIFCEFTSVREKAWRKQELRKAERTMNIIVENKEDIAKMVVQLLTADGKVKTTKSNDHEKDR